MNEFKLINKINNNIYKDKNSVKFGIGDDCAVLKYNNEYDLLVTTDMLAEDIHFKTEWYSPSYLAKKVIYCNISDIHSCGGIPFAMTVSAGITGSISSKFLTKFITCIKNISRQNKIELIGGDTISSKKLMFSITMFGKVKKNKAIFRHTAKVNDKIYITGYPGLSGAGLYLLLNKNNQPKKFYYNFLINRHLIPCCISDNNLLYLIFSNANCMIDVSDGLSNELNHISSNSGKKLLIDYNSIPIHKNLKSLCKDYDLNPFNFILNSGEDFYLLFTSSKKLKLKNVFEIGHVKKGKGVYLKTENNIQKISAQGWEHKLN